MAVLSSSSVVALNSHFSPFLPPSLPIRGILARQAKGRCLLRLSTSATRVSSQKSKLLPITAAVKEMDVSKVVPQADRVLIKLEELPQKSVGGVVLPKSAVKFEHYLCGEVLSVGKEVGAVSVGQKVLFSDLNAYEVNLGTSEKLAFCKAGDLLALVE